MDSIYPLTIIADRYQGTYSGGAYLAFNLNYDEIPPEVSGSDLECDMFWRETNLIVGKGSTTFFALMDLILKLNG